MKSSYQVVLQAGNGMDHTSLFKILLSQIENLETPCFVFDLKVIEHNIQKCKEALRPERLFFAVRCNPLFQVLQRIHKSDCSFDIGNLEELKLSASLGQRSSHSINCSPITPAKDIAGMYNLGVRYFCADSLCQVDNLAINAPGGKAFIRLASSDIGSGIGENHRLGVEPGRAKTLIKHALNKGVHICGLCFHPGSQCINLENWKAGIAACARLARDFPDLKILHIGGGFPVFYQSPVPDVKAVGSTILQAIRNYYPFQPRLWIQPSRFLVANAAITLSTALLMDDTCYPRRLFVDASVLAGHEELLTARKKFQYPVCSLAPGHEFFHYRVHGCTNSGVDTFAQDALLPVLNVDYDNPARSSRVVFTQTGAYCPGLITKLKPSAFNGARVPGVYFVQDNQVLQ